jgi:DNA-binding CsgD family transcriptional regulator
VRLQLRHERGSDGAVDGDDLSDVHELLRLELERPDPSWPFLDHCARAVVPRLVGMLRDEAERLATRLHEVAQGQGRRPCRRSHSCSLRGHVCRATKPGRSRPCGWHCRLTAETGSVQIYAEVGAPLAPLLVAALVSGPRPQLAEHVRHVLRVLDGPPPASRPAGRRSSERERDIMLVLAAHASTKAVARALGLAPETVKHHLKRIYAKLGVHTREEALARVARLGG